MFTRSKKGRLFGRPLCSRQPSLDAAGPIAPLGHLQSYDRSGNRRANDRFQSTAAIGRRPLERDHSPKWSIKVLLPDRHSMRPARQQFDQPNWHWRPRADNQASRWLGQQAVARKPRRSEGSPRLRTPPRGWRQAHQALEGSREGGFGVVAHLLRHRGDLVLPAAKQPGPELHAPTGEVLHRRLPGQFEKSLVQGRA